MNTQIQQKERLPPTSRHTLPIRLEKEAHAELVQRAEQEQRSMAFIAMRRYQAGLELEQAEQPN